MNNPKIEKKNIFLNHWLYPFLLMIFTMSMVFTLFKWYAYIFNHEPWINNAWTDAYPFKIILGYIVLFLFFFGIPIIAYMVLIRYLVYRLRINIWIKWAITLLVPIILFITSGLQIHLYIDDIGEYVDWEYFTAFEVMAIVYFLYCQKKIKNLTEWSF